MEFSRGGGKNRADYFNIRKHVSGTGQCGNPVLKWKEKEDSFCTTASTVLAGAPDFCVRFTPWSGVEPVSW